MDRGICWSLCLAKLVFVNPNWPAMSRKARPCRRARSIWSLLGWVQMEQRLVTKQSFPKDRNAQIGRLPFVILNGTCHRTLVDSTANVCRLHRGRRSDLCPEIDPGSY